VRWLDLFDESDRRHAVRRLASAAGRDPDQ
jgi:hypothetical protein